MSIATIQAPTASLAPYPRTERQERFIEFGARMAEIEEGSAQKHDRAGSFPHHTFDELRHSGFLALTLPEEFGGSRSDPIETMMALGQLSWQFAAAKYAVTNSVIAITDQAMRVVGSLGQQRKFPLVRYFRDVRAGIGNPPMDEVALTLIGKSAPGIR